MDFQWIKPGEVLLSAQGNRILLYDLNYYKSPERLDLYPKENLDKIIRPYAKVQTTMCDFSLNDDIAIYSEPIGIQSRITQRGNDFDYADQFIDHLNNNVTAESFFEPVPQAT